MKTRARILLWGIYLLFALAVYLLEGCGGGMGDLYQPNIAPEPAPREPFTIVALPDTQYYSLGYPALFTTMTSWIVENKDEKNIVFVNVDWDTYAKADLTTSLNIPRRSTLVVLKGSDELGRIVAGTSREEIQALMDTALKASMAS